MQSSVVAGHVRPTNWLGNCQGVPPLSYPWRGRVTDENLCVFEKVFGGETAHLWVRKSHVSGCDTPLRRPGSWRNNFLRRRTWRLRHDTLVRRRVSQRLQFATSRLRQALVRQGPAGMFNWDFINNCSNLFLLSLFVFSTDIKHQTNDKTSNSSVFLREFNLATRSNFGHEFYCLSWVLNFFSLVLN